MSAAASTTSRRPAAPAPSRPAPSQQQAPARRASGFEFVDGGDEIKINLADIQLPQKESMEIEGFAPTLLSRLFDLFAPLQKR